ncbi:ATP-binding protein [Streptomyces sp. NPDC052496]|uniref:ATP-binding protein n=1 Tax=Streptomyces sp. NPDC052496 TaxID=3154951 RepID=UPI0034403849
MLTLVTRFVLAGKEEEVSSARRLIIDKARSWGVPLDDETADAVRLVASELITNAVVHGEGPITVALYDRPGSLVIDVLDSDPVAALKANGTEADDESGRGLALVGFLAVRSGWNLTDRGKRVWAEIALPRPAQAAWTSILRRLFADRPGPEIRGAPASLPRAVA